MKSLPRVMAAVLLGGVVWLLGGCITHESARAPRVERVADFAVMETSKNVPLTPEQMKELRQAVISYLQEQGLAGDRLYYVKVTFPSDDPTVAEEWAIVRIGNFQTRTYTLLAAYPGADDSLPYDRYGYGYYDRFGSFSRYDYYDPFGYYYGGYAPPRDRPRTHDNRPDDKTDHPSTTRTRWDNDRPRRDNDHGRTNDRPRRDNDNDRPRRDYTPRDSGSDRWSGGGHSDSGGNRNTDSGSSRSYSPPPSPPPAPTYSEPAPRPEPAPATRDRYEQPTSEK